MTSGVRLIAGGPGNIECGQLTVRESKLSNQREHDINNVNARAVQQFEQQNVIPRTVDAMLIYQNNQLIDAPHDHVHQDYAWSPFKLNGFAILEFYRNTLSILKHQEK